MAVTKVANDFTILSDLIKHEYKPEWGYCRGNITVASAKVRGNLLLANGNLPADDAGVANVVGVVLKDIAGAGSAIVLKRGPVGILESMIQYGTLTKATVDAKLESLGIQVIKSAE